MIIARNISNSFPESIDQTSDSKAVNILNYIQTNIRHPEMLKVDVISNIFSISEKYVGRYFKKHAGETLQHYILNYKMKLVENRLLYSNSRVTEIAYEFGFTDKSHLNRTFKKYKGMSPSEYKKGIAKES